MLHNFPFFCTILFSKPVFLLEPFAIQTSLSSDSSMCIEFEVLQYTFWLNNCGWAQKETVEKEHKYVTMITEFD